MHYSEEKVIEAFRIYTKLARTSVTDQEAVQLYRADDDIRSLLDLYAKEVDAVIVNTSEHLYLIPETKLSSFHVSNDWIKRHYLRSGATNADIYLLYFTTIILFGSFYNSYQSARPTRDFLRIEEWMHQIQERIEQLQALEEEVLKEKEREFSYNWRQIVDKWNDMNDVKESAKRQTGNTISRYSFIDTVKRFLLDQDLVKGLGNQEITLTDKAQTIIQRYFMEVEYNKGILTFIYEMEGENTDAND
ncbi:non-ribosomal peptide synthetase module [Agaribacter marinus]|uniref:Non-ribosomal peptide synthetase module n=1 Tax=Virgibacillus salarius TaxID=447199 RepID=A0A941I8X3_9BACI|nr:DUF6063 family protein [uncultured Virgibacillus sp.]MBR7796114.1 non-ribosomal peptide synthetase module [Virgibacillus salarius]NAZ08823.1 non-ribosomal peptide synthetase module [Agaribacter marinus]